MVQYKIPYEYMEKFWEKASENKKNGHYIETLAFLVGFKENEIITVTDIVSSNTYNFFKQLHDLQLYFYFFRFLANNMQIQSWWLMMVNSYSYFMPFGK